MKLLSGTDFPDLNHTIFQIPMVIISRRLTHFYQAPPWGHSNNSYL